MADGKDKFRVVHTYLEDSESLFAEGFEEAVIGIVERFNSGPLVLYDRPKCIQILKNRDGMTHEEAEEFFEYNVIGSWVGDGTPCFATLSEDILL